MSVARNLSGTWDAVIVGGGPAGAAAAIHLARARRRVLLIDREDDDASPSRFKLGESLPPAARRLLRALGVLDRFLAAERAAEHLRALGNQSAWGRDTLATTDFLRDPDGHGWHLDRARFDAMLRDAARENGADWWPRTRVTGITRRSARGPVGVPGPSTGQEWSIDCLDHEGTARRARARWLVDASGRGGAFTATLGAERMAHDRLIAFAGLFRPRGDRAGAAETEDRDAMTLLEATADGWWYTARLPGARRVVVFHTDADLDVAKRARHAGDFRSLLKQTRHVSARVQGHDWRLDPATLTGAPAATTRRDPFAGDGWLAAGDAAAAFDPLSSQGIVSALYGGLKAGRAVDGMIDAAPETHPRIRHEYAEDIRRVVAAYHQHHKTFYRAEGRWRSAPFWRRRHGIPSPQPAP